MKLSSDSQRCVSDCVSILESEPVEGNICISCSAISQKFFIEDKIGKCKSSLSSAEQQDTTKIVILKVSNEIEADTAKKSMNAYVDLVVSDIKDISDN